MGKGTYGSQKGRPPAKKKKRKMPTGGTAKRTGPAVPKKLQKLPPKVAAAIMKNKKK
tara:strand:+ start:670 stop:840 length:171 start_codon:yes stop_codon:yes gene_type:complete